MRNQQNMFGAEPVRPIAPTNARAEAMVQTQQGQVVGPRQEPTIATAENPVVRFSTGTTPAPTNDKEMLENIATKMYKNEKLSDDEVKYVTNRTIEQKTREAEMAKQPTIEDFLSLSPEGQAVMASKLGFQGAQQVADIQREGMEKQGNVMDKRITREEERMKTERTALEGENASLLDEFKRLQQEETQAATDELQQAQGEEVEAIKGVFAGRGSSRQTATINAIQKSSDNTKKRISEIERASGRAVNEYQVKLLDRLDQKMEKLQARLDTAYDAKDDFKLKEIEAETKLATDLWTQNPQNPQKMMEVAQKISETRIAQKKELKESIAKNFSFMTENFGSQWLREMSPEGLQQYADNLDIPVDTLAKIGLTRDEQNMEWDKLKYQGTQQFELQKMLLGNEMDQENLMIQFNNDLKKLGIGHQFDVDLLDRKNAFEVDLATLKESLGDSKALGAWGGLIDKLGGATGYGGVAMGGNSNALSFDQPVVHPAVNLPVNSLNVALAQAFPDGFKFKSADGPDGLGGQCKWFTQLLTTLNGQKWSIGSTAAETKKNLDSYVKNGKAFYPGQGEAQVGNTIITNDSKDFWHSAAINAIQQLPNGKKRYVLTEANFKGPLTVSNSRIVDEDDPRIQGVLKTEPAGKYKVPEKILNGIGAAAKGSGAEDLFGKMTNIPNLLKALQGGVEGGVNRMVEGGKAEIEVANDPVNIIKNDPQLSAIASGAYKPSNDEMALLGKRAPQILPLVYKALEMSKSKEGQLSDTAKTNISKIKTAMDSLSSLENLTGQGEGPRWVNQTTPLIGGITGATQYEADEALLIENIGRLQSGGAISNDEANNFKNLLPRVQDDPSVRAYKLKRARQFLEDKLSVYGLDTENAPNVDEYADSLYQ